MCLSTVYKNTVTPETVAMKNVMKIECQGDMVILTDLMERQMAIHGELVMANLVEGVAVAKKAVKPNAANQQGGIVSQEAPIDASNVNLVCPECGKVTRVGHEKDGKNKLRVCKKCGHKF